MEVINHLARYKGFPGRRREGWIHWCCGGRGAQRGTMSHCTQKHLDLRQMKPLTGKSETRCAVG